jgi:hypothetical protein
MGWVIVAILILAIAIWAGYQQWIDGNENNWGE